MTAPEVSHGRGGAGNITPDNTKYVDGEIVRAGPEGSHGDGAFRAANIADADKPPSSIRADREIVPEEATRPSTDNESFHVGRGGAANVHLSAQDQQKHETKHNHNHHHHHHGAKVVDSPTAPGSAKQHQGLADKLKHKIFHAFKK
ncbi:hypothetical protein F5Y13DRAFT_192951 [Hypoxylon sp. FL1857]|nr:hypothetical protein F5Y13DRAFT_192951 [Hypoxylon sp. FL1857]